MRMDEVDKTKLSPMIQQYINIKEANMDSIVFYRVGDFYEMFFDDAYIASRELELQLTGKDAGIEERVPMCGIPFHAYEVYASKLLDRGFKIAIVEQIEDPKTAKGLVKRDVIKILTPGTVIDTSIESKENNYIACVYPIKRAYALVYADSSTGEINATILDTTAQVVNEIAGIKAKEVVVETGFKASFLEELKRKYNILISYEDKKEMPEYLNYIKNDDSDLFNPALITLVNYLTDTIKEDLSHLKKVSYYEYGNFMRLDNFTKKNLELSETMRSSLKNGTLLWLLDSCQTAMGSRMLRKWIDRPLIDKEQIENRLDFVEEFNNNFITKEDIKESLKTVYDLERITGRVSTGGANAKDLVQLRRSLSNIPQIKTLVSLLNLESAVKLASSIDEHKELYNLLDSALLDNPPLSIKEGGMIKERYNKDLDELKSISTNSRDWISNYEKSEAARTGIKGLKVGYNRVFGYYIEVTKSYLGMVQDDFGWERKQTLAAAERFISPELKKYESIILGADEKIIKLEYELFVELRNITKTYTASLQNLANIIASIDVYISLSDVSCKYNYVRPNVTEDRVVNIIDGAHPVISTMLDEKYVKNDVIINKYNTLLITGPNMSGKSTYMRELALIVIMAQIGSFVPAKSATLCIFDAIYTRIGASDDLLSGQSTFMVEMLEANYAIENATKNSLILFDELGRGTSTFDGMALAHAIIEYVCSRVKCAMLFSTHYHELISLEKSIPTLKNIHVSAKETKDGVVFLHKVLDGGADKSYGINVASLAGLPKSLIARAKEILSALEESNGKKEIELNIFNFDNYEEESSCAIVDEDAVNLKNKIDSLDLENITPREALNILYELKNR